MKILLTADLHFRTDWFRWLMDQAPSYDLVCIAGDLLDMFNVEPTKGQAREVSMLIRELADIVPVAICSGNHWCCITFRPKAVRVSAAKNRKPLTFFSPIDPIILFADMITNFPTYPGEAGDRISAKCASWSPVNCSVRPIQTISS